MNWQEIAGGVINALRNAGVKKDIIDLQEKQVALLTKEIDTLAAKLQLAEAENANLKQKAANLEAELKRIQPIRGKLKEGAEKILKFLFDKGDAASVRELSVWLGMQDGIVKHHCDVLYEADMINPVSLDEWYIIAKGRAYVVDNKLVG